MNKNFKHLLIASGLVVALTACSSGSTSSNNGGGNQGDASKLTFIAPNIAPSLPIASSSYMVVNNPTSSIITGIQYKLGGIVGGSSKVTLDPASAANCARIAANSSCSIKIITPANTLAGSFNVSASNNTTGENKPLAGNLPNTATIGSQQILYTTTTGANGITLYYQNTVIAGVPMVMVTGVVSSNQVGDLNTVTLMGPDNNPIPGQKVISGNMGAGAPKLGMGSTFSILLPVPAGTDATQMIKVKTEQIAANGTVSNTQISTNSSTLTTTTGVAIINMVPSSIYLTESNSTQQITFSNTGDVAAQLQSLVASNSNIEVVFSSTSVAPGGKATAILRLKDPSVPASSSSITLSYNNGKTEIKQSSVVDQNVVPGPNPTPVPPPGPTPVAGLTATLANNNFNVSTINHTTTESMTITNTGNTTENNFVVTMPNNNFSLVNNVGSATNCKVTSGAIDLSQSLESSTSCVVTVKYDNSNITFGSGNISIAYKYNNGTAAPTPTTAAVNWKVTQPTANLIITGNVANPYIFPTTLTNGSGESLTATFIIKNTGEIPATDVTSAVNSTTLAGLFTLATPACETTLAPNQSCQLAVKFGPIPDNTSAGTKNGNLTISYKMRPTTPGKTTIVQKLEGQIAANAVFNTPESGTATGFLNNYWKSLTINQSVTTGVITYTLTNTGAGTATDFVITLPSAPNGWTNIATTCPTTPGTNLAPQASCDVTLKPNTSVSGTITSTNFTLGLAWADQDSPSGETQNMQITTPAVAVVDLPPFIFARPTGIALNHAGTYAFIVNQQGNTVTRCSVDGGILSGCTNSGATELSTPFGIALNSAGTYAFITNAGNKTVTQCSVNNGTLSNCADSGASELTNPQGITLDPTGTYAFITNTPVSQDDPENSVIQCSVDGGTLSNCTNTGVTRPYQEPFGITLNSTGTYAFITDYGSRVVTQCSVNNGTLSSCTETSTGYLSPMGIALNPAGTYAFINSPSSATVIQCGVNDNSLNNCADSGATGLISVSSGIALNPAGTYAFITTNINTINQCSVNGNTLSNCKKTGFQ